MGGRDPMWTSHLVLTVEQHRAGRDVVTAIPAWRLGMERDTQQLHQGP